ncbi:MAG: lycopene cyclase domain-containing protein [Anaerolineae bacterium]|nr:lycopene cyclase domain-containing protein [Anaerolineae bacterium]
MTYFGFLAVFLVLPILALWALAAYDRKRGVDVPPLMQSWPAWVIVLAHVVIAVVYTTPWDNYLVATRVWWYDPKLVTGLLIGYVPIEEYTFFVLQPLLTGAWLYFIARHMPVITPAPLYRVRVRVIGTVILFFIWLVSVAILVFGWRPGTYLGLLLGWALPPLMIQSAFGADILWRHRRMVILTIVPMTLYLAAADKLAITSGTWTINPEQSVNILLLGRLPLEEFIFFFMTNTLIAVGITLVSSMESKARAERYLTAVRMWLTGKGNRTPLAVGENEA